MTRIEAEVAGAIEGERRSGSIWTQILVPLVTAALVLALGLLLVGVTSNSAETLPTGRSSVATPLR
jgi:hypothetical protein